MLTYISNDYLTSRNGIYYFQRRVPMDIRNHYHSHIIACSLKTRSRTIALKAAAKLSLELDNYWVTLRVNQLATIHCKKLKLSQSIVNSGVTFLTAKDLYLKLKGQGKAPSFHTYTERNVQYVIQAIGNKDLSDYQTSDGGKFRDWLIKKGLASFGLSLAQKVSVL